MKMKFEIKDGLGQVFNTVENPAALFDKATGTLHKIGERDVIIEHFNRMSEVYRVNELHDLADDLIYMELPREQEEIDKVFQITGYIKVLYEKAVPATH